MKYLIPLCLLLAGCAETRVMSDGSRERVDRYPGFVTPSITSVKWMPAGQTNWTQPTLLSGPGALGSAASGVSIIVPVGDYGKQSVNINSSASSTATAPLPSVNRPPHHWGKRDK